MGKSELKKIAQDWCKSILLANDMASFDEGVLTNEEQEYIVNECHKIANRITDRSPIFDLKKIIMKYTDSHSPDPVSEVDTPQAKDLEYKEGYRIDTLQEGDWFIGTKEQYRKIIKLSETTCNLFGLGALFQWGSILNRELDGMFDGKTQLTPEEFLRRAENTFKTK